MGDREKAGQRRGVLGLEFHGRGSAEPDVSSVWRAERGTRSFHRVPPWSPLSALSPWGDCAARPGGGASLHRLRAGRVHASSAKSLTKGAPTGNQSFKAEIDNDN